MEGVTWSKSKGRYRAIYRNIDTLLKSLCDACDKIMKHSNEDILDGENTIVPDDVLKNFFSYKNYYLLLVEWRTLF